MVRVLLRFVRLERDWRSRKCLVQYNEVEWSPPDGDQCFEVCLFFICHLATSSDIRFIRSLIHRFTERRTNSTYACMHVRSTLHMLYAECMSMPALYINGVITYHVPYYKTKVGMYEDFSVTMMTLLSVAHAVWVFERWHTLTTHCPWLMFDFCRALLAVLTLSRRIFLIPGQIQVCTKNASFKGLPTDRQLLDSVVIILLWIVSTNVNTFFRNGRLPASKQNAKCHRLWQNMPTRIPQKVLPESCWRVSVCNQTIMFSMPTSMMCTGHGSRCFSHPAYRQTNRNAYGWHHCWCPAPWPTAALPYVWFRVRITHGK